MSIKPVIPPLVPQGGIMGTANPQARIDKILAEIKGVTSMYNVGSADLRFMHSIATHSSLTPAQEQWLRDIEAKVFEEDDDAS